MDPDLRYECALAAALEILNAVGASPDVPKHERLAMVIFTILAAMTRYEEHTGDRHAEFSVN